MYRKLSKKAKIMNILNRGSSVTWKQLKTTYNLKSPRAMIDTIRRDGVCVYANKDKRGNTFSDESKCTRFDDASSVRSRWKTIKGIRN